MLPQRMGRFDNYWRCSSGNSHSNSPIPARHWKSVERFRFWRLQRTISASGLGGQGTHSPISLVVLFVVLIGFGLFFFFVLKYMAGKMKVDEYISFVLHLTEINEAFHKMHEGAIRTVVNL